MHVAALLLVLVSAEANWGLLLFTRWDPSESRSSAIQACCLCTVLLWRRRLVPLALRALIPLPCVESRDGGGAQPRSLSVRVGPAPLPFQPAAAPLCSQPIPWPSSVKASKPKGFQALWRRVARCPGLCRHERMEKKCNE